jgi:leader peptidase (prepilin peptidase) / N-methyltransferase
VLLSQMREGSIVQRYSRRGLHLFVVTVFIAVVAGVYGLVLGSFLNVVIWRVPRRESIVKPRSHCPACDTQIATRDNIPLVSWIALRGRCRHCGNPISIRYPLVELFTGVLFAAVGVRFAHSWALPAFLVLTGALIAISVIDLEHFIIPNRIVYPVGIAGVVLLGLAALIQDHWGAFGRSLLGALAAFTFFFVLHLVSPRGMGFGDVRLSFVLGLFLGWLGWAQLVGGLFAGFFFGAVIGILLIAVGGRDRRQHIPFGPYLAAGTMTFVLAGDQLVGWWRALGR